MIIRELQVEEWGRLKPIFEAVDEPLPLPGKAAVVVAEDGEKIVGLFAVQLIPVCEPLWVDEVHRDTLLPRRLIRAMRQFYPSLNWLLMHTTNEKIARMAIRFGAELLPWKTLRWRRK